MGKRIGYQLLFHKSSGRAYIWDPVQKKNIYLGLWPEHPANPSKEVRAAFRAEVARLTLGTAPAPVGSILGATIAELVDGFLENSETRLKGRRSAANLRFALQPLIDLFADLQVEDFGPKRFHEVRVLMAKQGRTRQGVNHAAGVIRQCIKWGVSQELVRPEKLTALQSLTHIRPGEIEAPESQSKRAVPLEVVRATLPYLSPTVAAMVQVQVMAGMRPGEVCSLSMPEIDTTDPECWVYRPEAHKTAHKGRIREIPLIPEAIAVLRPFLRLDGKPLFDPAREAERWQIENRGRETLVMVRPGARYTTNSYRQAIIRGCQKVRAWQKEQKLEPTHPDWSPNQLRKAAAQTVSDSLGLEAARALLNHSTTAITSRHYARTDLAQAKVAALAIAPAFQA